MRAPLLILGILGAGLIGAAAGQVLFPAAAPAPESVPVPLRLQARVNDLEEQVARLRQEIVRPPVVRTLPRLPPTADAIREPTNGEPFPPASPSDDLIEEKVRKVITDREQVARDARAKKTAADRAAKDEQFLGRLQAALDLTEFQREELKRHLHDRRAAYADYKRKVGAKGITKQEADVYRQNLVDWVADQDVEMTKLLGVEKFDRLMELTTPKKR